MFGIQASSVRTLSLTRLQKQKGSTVLLYAYYTIIDNFLKNDQFVDYLKKDKNKKLKERQRVIQAAEESKVK